MALAIDEGRPHRASAAMACHLLELLDGVVESSKTGQYVQMQSSFDKPEPLAGDEMF
jgi:hypothetical protein